MDDISVVGATTKGIRDVKRGRGIVIGAVGIRKIKENFLWVNICNICYKVTVEIVNL